MMNERKLLNHYHSFSMLLFDELMQNVLISDESKEISQKVMNKLNDHYQELLVQDFVKDPNDK